MFNPPHPGESVRVLCLEPFELSVADAARHLQIAEADLDGLCEGRADMTPDMAIRLEQAFGSTADAWMRMQAAYDLARARRDSNGPTIGHAPPLSGRLRVPL